MSEEFVPGLRYHTGAQELWSLVVELLGGWEERINSAAADQEMTPVSAWALVQLDPDNPMSQKELASRLHCKPSTVVDPTDRLEEAGLVVRSPHPNDRRVNVLTITPRGKRVRFALIQRLFTPPEAFERLSPGEQARLRDAMLAAVGRVRLRK